MSASGFSLQAKKTAAHYGIDLRLVSEIMVADINPCLRLDFVLFNHKRCSLAHVALRRFRETKWTVPLADDMDFEFVRTVDPSQQVFLNTEAGNRWSLNDMWHQVQHTCDPFAGIERGAPPIIRTACFPYPGNVTVESAAGPQRLGDVILGVALAIELEHVTLEEANKISYAGTGGMDLQRVEFRSTVHDQSEWSIAIQAPRTSTNPEEVRSRFVSPDGASAPQ